jgi:hypothetical protein
MQQELVGEQQEPPLQQVAFLLLSAFTTPLIKTISVKAVKTIFFIIDILKFYKNVYRKCINHLADANID